MRIAVCLSGQLREWRQCYTSWNILFNELKKNPKLELEDIQIDYFVHTWDFNSKSYSVWTAERFGQQGFVEPPTDQQTSNEIEEFIKIIQPKKFIVENEEKSSSRKSKLDERTQFRLETYKWSPLGWAGGQLYSIMMAGHLKKQYELENGFRYDMCVRLRPDLYFDDLNRRIFVTDFVKPKPKTLYTCHGFPTDEMPHDGIGDIFFYSDSETYDVVSSLYNWLPQLDPFAFRYDFKIEEMLVYVARMFHIGASKIKIDPEVRR